MFDDYIPQKPLSNPTTVVTTKGTGSNNISSSQTLVSLVTTDDENGFETYTIHPIGKERTQITLTYNRNELKSLSLKKYENKVETGRFSFPNSNSVVELKKFLNTVWNIDIEELNSGKLILTNSADSEIYINILNNINLKNVDASNLKSLIKKIVNETDITEEDLDLICLRKRSLEEFEQLLSDTSPYIAKYCVTDTKEEKVWQHFFEQNKWIFGLNFDYKFNKILNTEHTVGLGNVDFLLGNKFTVLVEIKTPKTKLFKGKKRSDAWGISTEISDAKSQILQYKANWQINYNDKRNNKDMNGNTIKQSTIDPKCILLVGNYNEEIKEFDDDKSIVLVEETFEMFRRDSRNIEILTFDELFERVKYVINQI